MRKQSALYRAALGPTFIYQLSEGPSKEPVVDEKTVSICPRKNDASSQIVQKNRNCFHFSQTLHNMLKSLAVLEYRKGIFQSFFIRDTNCATGIPFGYNRMISSVITVDFPMTNDNCRRTAKLEMLPFLQVCKRRRIWAMCILRNCLRQLYSAQRHSRKSISWDRRKKHSFNNALLCLYEFTSKDKHIL